MKWFGLIAVLLLAGCFECRAQGKMGTIYLIRGKDTVDYPQQLGVLNPEAVVYLDGVKFVSMGEQTFVGVKLPVGRYLLEMKGEGALDVVDVAFDRTYYVQVSQHVSIYKFQVFYDVSEKARWRRSANATRSKKRRSRLSNTRRSA
jgi:hypothetical protein